MLSYPNVYSKNNKNRTIKTISLFSGCGGLDLGVSGGFKVHKKSVNSKSLHNWVRLPKTPFDIVFANDIMQQAKAVWQRHFKGVYVTESIRDLVQNNYVFPDAELVIGGFPCQDFSVAGKRKGFNSKRGTLYQAMVDVVENVQPKAFIAENVYGLLSIEGAKQKIIRDFEKLGYTVYAYAVNAVEYGVPQSRKRIFFIGLKSDKLKRKVDYLELLPPPTHKNPVTLSDIFFDLEEPEYSNNIEQKSYSKAKWYGKKCQGNTEVKLDNVGPTIRAEHHGNIEFRRLSQEHGGNYAKELKEGMKERRLTIKECARIQTFPDNFRFIQDSKGTPIISTSSAYKVIGNAVPPLLAYHFSKKLADLWSNIL